MVATRKRRGLSFHLEWAGVFLAFLVPAALTTEEPAVASVLAACAVGTAIGWAATSGWRMQAPLRRLPEQRELTETEKAERESARLVRETLNQLFHAAMKPSGRELRRVLSSLSAQFRAKPEPYVTFADVVDLFVEDNLERGGTKVRAALEGTLWREREENPEYEQLARLAADLDLEKMKTADFALPVLDLYRTYRLDLRLAERLARLLQLDPKTDDAFLPLREADKHLTSRLREVLALSELATFREDFERWIAL